MNRLTGRVKSFFFRCRSQGPLSASTGACSPASGLLALAVQLVATLHLHDPCDLQRARDALAAAGFHSDADIMAAIDNGPEISAHPVPIITAAEARASELFSPSVKSSAASGSSQPPASVVAYSHGMLAHAHVADSVSQDAAALDLSDLSVSAAVAPVRAAHPERPDRLRAAGYVTSRCVDESRFVPKD